MVVGGLLHLQYSGGRDSYTYGIVVGGALTPTVWWWEGLLHLQYSGGRDSYTYSIVVGGALIPTV